MHLYIAGRGAMAHAQAARCEAEGVPYSFWTEAPNTREKNAAVLHVGGREKLLRAIPWCEATRTPLIHAASGLDDCLPPAPKCVIVRAPNLSLNVIAFLEMIPDLRMRARTNGTTTRIIVSHQLTKMTPPGTAYAIAELLGVSPAVIEQLQTPEEQREFGVKSEHLERHSVHHVQLFKDSRCTIDLRIQVNGLEEYAEGALAIARALVSHPIENGYYSVPYVLGWNK